jgi:hypothetical protein
VGPARNARHLAVHAALGEQLLGMSLVNAEAAA